MLSARVIRKKQTNYPRSFAEVQKQFLPAAGLMVEGAAKALTPVDTGRLRGSITSRVKGEEAIIGTNVEYSAHVEYGTRFMRAQPYMRPALDNNRRNLVTLFQRIFDRVFSHG